MRRTLLLAAGMILAGTVFAQPEKPAAAPAASEPTVTLLDPGAKDGRRELRLRPKVGSESSMVMKMRMAMKAEVNGQPLPTAPAPTISMTMGLKVDKVEESGDFHYVGTYSDATPEPDPKIDAAMMESLRKAFSGIKGLGCEVLSSDRGIVRSGKVTAESAAAPLQALIDSMNQSLQQMSLPLPKEAVGAGAKWRATSAPRVGGFVQKLTCEYSLKEWTPQGAKLEMTVVQSAEPQDMDLPTLPAGTSAKLTSLTGTGKGTSEIAWDGVMPVASSITTNAEIKMSFKTGDESTAMNQKIETTMSIARQEPKPAK